MLDRLYDTMCKVCWIAAITALTAMLAVVVCICISACRHFLNL